MVDLADSLVDDFDVVDLLTILTDRCIELLGVSASGIVLRDPTGALRVMLSSSDAMHLLELFELQAAEGPCLECVHDGRSLVNVVLAAAGDRWPRFAPLASEAGFRTVHAFPMRLRGEVIGALNLFSVDDGVLSDADARMAQALTDVATISILQHRIASEAQTLNAQLNHALQSRIRIEQVKGMVAEQGGLAMDRAFDLLRDHARSHNRRLVEVAEAVIAGTATAASLGR
ncbi:GAF and ANTAR domain-containing protein [Iamia sp. SCSIO 61187]|nr:GAF and ANTAR domain-containing protein [Iamia sp. SCSIO 61187]